MLFEFCEKSSLCLHFYKLINFIYVVFVKKKRRNKKEKKKKSSDEEVEEREENECHVSE